MLNADVGNHCHSRTNLGHAGGDFAEVIHPQFHDSAVIAAVQAEQGLGHPHLIVEVSLGLEAAETALQDGGNHFFGGSFSHGAGHRHNF